MLTGCQPVRGGQSQAYQPEEGRDFFFFCRKCLGERGPQWVGKRPPSRWLVTRIIPFPRLPDEVPLASDVKAIKWLIKKALLSIPAEGTALLHLLGCPGTGVPAWCSPMQKRDQPGEAAESD